MVWLCVTFKFVCFDGIEGKKLADEVAREKGERKKENKKRKRKKVLSSVWNVLECEVVGKKRKEGNKEKKGKSTCVKEKKRGGKKGRKMKKEIWIKK